MFRCEKRAGRFLSRPRGLLAQQMPLGVGQCLTCQNETRALRASTFAASRPGTFFRSSSVLKEPFCWR